jgi:hypothetical protein
MIHKKIVQLVGLAPNVTTTGEAAMYTYKIKDNQLETYENEQLIHTSLPLEFDDWAGFVNWVEHFTTTAAWTADFLQQCYIASKEQS